MSGLPENPLKSSIAWLAIAVLVASSPPALAQKAPKIEVVSETLDAGTVPKGKVIETTFVIKNHGGGDLVISDARPRCGCTLALFDKVIKPGGEGKVQASVDTKSFSGPISKSVLLVSNDPERGQINLFIKATVKPFVEVLPQPYVRLSVVKGDTDTRDVILVSEEKSFKPRLAEAAQPYVKAEISPAGEKDRIPGHPGEQYKVRITVTADAPEGLLNAPVRIATSVSQQPSLEIPISGIVRARVSGSKKGAVSSKKSTSTQVRVTQHQAVVPVTLALTAGRPSTPQEPAKGEPSTTVALATGRTPAAGVPATVGTATAVGTTPGATPTASSFKVEFLTPGGTSPVMVVSLVVLVLALAGGLLLALRRRRLPHLAVAEPQKGVPAQPSVDSGLPGPGGSGWKSAGTDASPATGQTDDGGIPGEVRSFQTRNEQPFWKKEPTTVWTFVLERLDSAGNRLTPVAVEMRGQSFRGSINEGHQVKVYGVQRAGRIIAHAVHDLTTGQTVTAGGSAPLHIAVIVVLSMAFLAVLALLANQCGSGCWQNINTTISSTGQGLQVHPGTTPTPTAVPTAPPFFAVKVSAPGGPSTVMVAGLAVLILVLAGILFLALRRRRGP